MKIQVSMIDRRSYDLLLGRVVFIVSLLSLFGCASLGGGKFSEGLKITQVRPSLPGTRVVEKVIEKEKFEKALDSGQKNEIRLVEVFSRESSDSTPREYRFFGIEEDSVYTLLGLQSLDILIAANDYVVPGGAYFWQYLQLLRYEEEAKIEIRREGVPMVFEYTFKGEGPSIRKALLEMDGLQ